MDIVELWGQTIKDAVNRFAANRPKEIKEDFEQECYLAVVEKLDVLENILKEQDKIAAKNYVYATCRFVVRRLLKNAEKHAHEPFSQHTENPSIPDSQFEKQDVDEAIKHLPREEQHVIREIFFLGKTERDVAKALNKPKTWVNSIKQEAISRLRDILQ